jgi:hypothetical protein
LIPLFLFFFCVTTLFLITHPTPLIYSYPTAFINSTIIFSPFIVQCVWWIRSCESAPLSTPSLTAQHNSFPFPSSPTPIWKPTGYGVISAR